MFTMVDAIHCKLYNLLVLAHVEYVTLDDFIICRTLVFVVVAKINLTPFMLVVV